MKMNKPLFKRTVPLAVLMMALVAIFQNCGDQPLNKTEDNSKSAAFFEYPYDVAPVFYADMQLFKAATAPAGLSEFTFVGTVAYQADASKPINYQVRVKRLDDSVLCPTQSGTVPVGSSLITFNCVSTGLESNAKLELTVTANGVTEVFKKTY